MTNAELKEKKNICFQDRRENLPACFAAGGFVCLLNFGFMLFSLMILNILKF